VALLRGRKLESESPHPECLYTFCKTRSAALHGGCSVVFSTTLLACVPMRRSRSSRKPKRRSDGRGVFVGASGGHEHMPGHV
jgi:hypothetical protein